MDRALRGLTAVWAAGLALLILLAWAGPIAAKPAAQGGAKADDQGKDDADLSAENVFPTADRSLLLLLSKARQLVSQERYAEAVQCLGTILEAPEDAFLRPDSKADLFPGLKAEAHAILGRLPRQGRELYELQCGARARSMLSAAAAAGDAAGLAEVSRRFFHTRAGYEATFLLGLHQWNHGSPLAAAMTLKRLKDSCPVADEFEPGLSVALAASWFRAGNPDKARPVLDELRQRFPHASVRIGGKDVSLAGNGWSVITSGAKALAGSQAAAGWLMDGGDPARNASVSASGPLLSTCWRIPTAEHPFVESLIDQIQQSNRDQDRWALPALHPLVVNNVVLMRTARNLLAVDFVTGKRIWEVPGDDPFESVSESSLGITGGDEDPFGGRRGGALDLQTVLRYRLWGDATFGTLTSDGQRVFAVEDLSLDLGTASTRAMFMPNRRALPSDPKPFNRLAAYEIRTGKLVWQLGGSAEELGLPQAGTFFLGPPLPVSGQLYAIAEQKGDIRLLVLDAKTGNVAWTQQLGVVDQDRDILQDPLRRVSGVSPSYADGILVCPTSNKSVVALEPATRSLLWGYVYKPGDSAQPRQPPMFFGVSPPTDPEPANRWAHTEVVLAEGRALVTPVDSSELHCLNLIDGKLLWRKPRQDDIYLACVYQGKAILVGRRGLRALKLADGEPAWPRAVEFQSAMPSGTGFLSGDRYYVPLTSGEVKAADLNSGQIAHTYQSRRGVVPGNLVCSGGRVLSQGGGALDLFFQLDALRKQVDQRLAAKPDDADAIAQRGEILWDEGKLKEAIDCFRRSLKLTPSPNARGLLRDALLEGLRTDFAGYLQAGEEIRGLLDEPRQEALYLRLTAAGFEQAKQFRPALERYLKLIELDRQQRELEVVDKSHSVRRDRWIQVRLAELRKEAPADVQSEIDRATQARLDAAVKTGSVEALQQFLDYFGMQPSADQARRRLAAKLCASRRLLAAEMLLRRMERSENRQTAGEAVAELASMLRDAKLVDDAAGCYRRLREEFGDVVCRDGKTGRQLAQSLPEDDLVRRGLEPPARWPTGEIVVESKKKKPGESQPMAFYSLTVPYQNERGPFFSDLDVEVHQNPNPPSILARDGWGKVRWQMPISDLMRNDNFPMSSAFLRVTVDGHLMLLSMGFKIVAIDTLAAARGGTPKVLWVQDLEEPVRTVMRRGRGRVVPAGMPAMRVPSPFSNAQFPTNIPAAISEQLVCYQRFQNLYGVDPVNGEVLWVRDDVRPDSVVFGDEQYVFVLPPDQAVATVLRAADGKEVGTRKVPPVRPATLGRLVAAWHQDADHSVLELIDPWTDARVWPPRKFAADAKIYPVDDEANEAIGILEPKGRFALVNLADGRLLVDAKVDREAGMSDVHVFRSPRETLVVINGLERTSSPGRHYYGLQGVPSVQLSRAKIYAFDAQGKALWREPVIVQDQYLVQHQPQRLPALVFACGVQDRRGTSMGQPRTSILGVDKRTGQKVHPKERFDGLSHFRLQGDPEKKVIEVHLQRDLVTLNFTDKPVPTPPKVEAKKPAAKTSSALLKAMRRAVEGALNLPGDDEEDDSGDNR